MSKQQSKGKGKVFTGSTRVTPVWEVIWGQVKEPDTKYNEDGEYYIDFVLSPEQKDEFLASIRPELDKLLAEAIEKCESAADRARFQKIDFDDLERCLQCVKEEKTKTKVKNKNGKEIEELVPTGNFKVRMKNRREKPQVIDAKKDVFTGIIGRGDTARAAFKVRVFQTPQTSGGTLLLEGVQLVTKRSGSSFDAGKAFDVVDAPESGGSSEEAPFGDEE